MITEPYDTPHTNNNAYINLDFTWADHARFCPNYIFFIKMTDAALAQLLQNIANAQGTQTQAISQLNHDYTQLSIDLAALAVNVEWLKWFFLVITVAILTQTVKIVYDHFNNTSHKKR